MEWVLVVAVVVVVVWLLGRSRPAPPPPAQHRAGAHVVRQVAAGTGASGLAAEVARRAADPDDPAGAFMDGYVSGRYTQQHEDLTRAGRSGGDGARPSVRPASDDDADDAGDDAEDDAADDHADDLAGDRWSSREPYLRHDVHGGGRHDVHHDVHHDPFDDDASDDW